MIIFILLTSAVICLMLLLGLDKRRKTKEYIQWGLGVDSCCFYSPPFSVDRHQITIAGFQDVLDHTTAIRYSVVKMNWLGKREVFGQGCISGDFKNPKHFRLRIKDIPNGEDYKIEVYNDFRMSCGQFKIE